MRVILGYDRYRPAQPPSWDGNPGTGGSCL